MPLKFLLKSRHSQRRSRPLKFRNGKFSTAAVSALVLASCTGETTLSTAASSDQAWSPNGQATSDFSVDGAIGTVDLGDDIKSGKAYDLPQLIDLGQKSHPATRIAWQQARQAAAGVGMVEGTFLPIITANVIGGVQDVITPLPDLQGGTSYVDTDARGVVPNITLQWLLFDFGERQAWKTAAEQTAYAANVNFNGTHQLLIHDISRAYYQYGAAQENMAIAERAYQNSLALQEAAESRFANGIGTSIETAQAKQIVAQSKFRVVQAKDGWSNSYQDLLGAVGVSPRSKIKIATSSGRRLPRSRAMPTDQLIEKALSRRPDVLASYAMLKASEANELAADAAFRPKVYLGAVAADNSGRIQTGALPGIGLQNTTTGVVVGASIPIYDGEIRKNKRLQAQAETAAAAAAHEQAMNVATREIIMSSNALESALASYEAASEMRKAAQVAYDAAFEGYRNGLGTLTDVSAVDTGLLDAKQAQADSHAAALIAASTMAFALGNLTSQSAPARALR
ncbi:MAG: TolC family protein [Sedimentitalea sp.]|uniref:TolC family protein n=1 Tax=Sedimentitalea sp. TaxID=2048915 RepID=UPI0032667136